MFIIASKPGQLGNRLLLFTQFIACAREHGVALANPTFDDFAEFFETTSVDLFCRYPARPSPFAGSRRLRALLFHASYYAARVVARSPVRFKRLRAVTIDWDERLELCAPDFIADAGRPGRLVFFQGWEFAADAAMAREAAAVREFFRPREQFREAVASLVARAREGCDVLVGVHVRHGDYRTFQGGKYFYELDAYVALMRRVEALFPGRRVGFLVCSNAPQDEGALARFNYTLGAGHVIEDLYALARCDYLVGPPSTFTMWASFYGEVPLWMVRDPSLAPRLEDFAVYGVGTPASSS